MEATDDGTPSRSLLTLPHSSLRGLLLSLALLVPGEALAGTVGGTLVKWHAVTVDFAGPVHGELDSNPNPFLDYRLQVEFTAPSGNVYSVPGFFAGDGLGGETGGVWRVRFSPDEAGLWGYQASFRSGTDVAVSLDPGAGTATGFDGEAGSFSVAPLDPSAPGYLRYGRLESIGDFYLKFRDGGFWLKGGVNNPDNFLGYAGFDNSVYAHHQYAAHVSDWQPGDPDWDSPDNPGSTDGRGIIGAVNYLASQGINAIYFMAMNIGGDGRDAWPYASPNIDRDGSTSNDNLHFDNSKLAQWETVFAHAQRKGVALHLVLAETEEENKRELDDATLGVERKLFYRELVARFGHHNALQWNLSEEYNLKLPLAPSVIKQFGEYMADVDPYDHPITVHTHGNTYATALAPFFGDAWFKIMSVQTWQRPDDISDAIEFLRGESVNAGNPVPIGLDEAIGMNQISADSYRKRAIWDALFSGGHFEVFKSGDDSDLEDYSVYQQYMVNLRIAREFVEANLPFWEMVPDDDLLTGEDTVHGGGEVLTKPGEIYAVYLPSAQPNATLALDAAPGGFEQQWFDPRTGAFAGAPIPVSGGAGLDLGPPPYATDDDWVVLVRNDGGSNQVPTVADQDFATPQGVAVPITLDFEDLDGPGPNSFAITSPPSNGTLSSVGGDGSVVYTPDPAFFGLDEFEWRVNDGLVDSAVATVRLIVGDELLLLEDLFDRPDGPAVGAGWVEFEESDALVEIADEALFFADTSDQALRPLVEHSFARSGAGLLEWVFLFDWSRTGSENSYRLYMQLGDAAAMSELSADQGVGVNLVWTRIDGVHASLGSRVGGVDTAIAPLDGPHWVRVSIDLDSGSYDVHVDDQLEAADVPFDGSVLELDRVRFLADGINENNFARRSFDEVRIRSIVGAPNRAPVAQGQTVQAQAGTPLAIGLQASDPDGDPLQFVVVGPPSDGSLQSDDGDDMITYESDPGFSGTDHIDFLANDGDLDSNVATVTIEVMPEPAGSVPLGLGCLLLLGLRGRRREAQAPPAQGAIRPSRIA